MSGADQLDMFTTTPEGSVPTSSRPLPPTRGHPRKPASAAPAVAADALAEVNFGRFGLLDDTDRIVVFEDDQRIRLALDEDVLTHLIAQGYIEPGPNRDTVTCLHGVIRRPVTPLRLTKRGHALLSRWSALHPLH